MLVYPESFKEKVRKLYPYDFELHKAVEEGRCCFVGNRLLSTSESVTISTDAILNAKSLKDIYDLAKEAMDKRALYYEWQNLSK